MEGLAARRSDRRACKQHLIALGEWSEERHAALEKELEAHVSACWKEAVELRHPDGGADARSGAPMFEDVYQADAAASARQREELQELRRLAPAETAEEQRSSSSRRARGEGRLTPWRT